MRGLRVPEVDCFRRGSTNPQDLSGHARTVPNCLRTWSPLAKTLAKKPEQPSGLGVYDDAIQFNVDRLPYVNELFDAADGPSTVSIYWTEVQAIGRALGGKSETKPM